MKWDAHIYSPRTETTSTKVVDVPDTTSMADSAYACWFVGKKFKVPQKYVLCVPHRGENPIAMAQRGQVDDGMYVVQATWQPDGHIDMEASYDYKAEAIRVAKRWLTDPLTESDEVRIISRDGELVWGPKKVGNRNPLKHSSDERLYRVIWVRDDKGTRGVLAPGPFTHREAVTVMSKITKYPWRRVLVEEIQNNPLSTGAKWAIGLGVAGGLGFLGFLIWRVHESGTMPAPQLPQSAPTAPGAASQQQAVSIPANPGNNGSWTVPLGAGITWVPSGGQLWNTPGPVAQDATILSTNTGNFAFVAIGRGTTTITGSWTDWVSDPSGQTQLTATATITVK
jgi:hypothetical protein